MLVRFPILIQYGQVLVHGVHDPRPGLIWTDDHVAQGFAWTDGIAAFGVPDHDGECHLEVTVCAATPPLDDALWAVQTPFVVDGPIAVGTVFDTHRIDVAEGTYNLVFLALADQGGDAFTLRLIFIPAGQPAFAILKQGGDVTAPTVLRRNTERAG